MAIQTNHTQVNPMWRQVLGGRARQESLVSIYNTNRFPQSQLGASILSQNRDICLLEGVCVCAQWCLSLRVCVHVHVCAFMHVCMHAQ